MKKEKPTLLSIFGCIFISAMVFTAAANAQNTTNWVAINDHHKGTASSPYANFYNPLRDDAGVSGALTNTVSYALLLQGAQTPAYINITSNGAPVAANSMGAPNTGTPAGDWFRPYVDFGNGNRDAVQLQSGSSITYTFSGLDPLKRYIFKGTAARAYGGGYVNRWTLATIDGVNSYTHSHKPTWAEASISPNFGVLTSNDGGTMNANQAAWCSGENAVAGAMIVFTDIDPGSDGSFSITVQTYSGNVPGGSANGSYGYAFSAFSLEELIVSINDPIQITSVPTNQTLLEGQALILSVSVLGSLPQYQWYKNDVAIPNATNRTYQVLHALPGDSGSYYVKVWNHINSTNTPSVNIVVTSEPLVITNGLQDMGVFEASTVVLTIGVSGTFPQYKWYKNNQPISGATNSSLTITNFSPADAGTYMVLITNSTSQVTSTAKLTYIADTIPPKIVSAIASTNLLTVDVLFSEPVSNEATDYGNYLLIPEGGYPITPLDVLKTSPTNFTLSFLPGDIRYGKHYSISASYIFDTSRQFNEVDSTPVPIAMYYGNLISIDESTMWRFESRGYDYSNAWYRLDFDDSGWSNGAALFVSKEGTIPTYPQPIRTFMNASNYLGTEKVCTYYFRTWFKFTGDDPQHSAIILKTIIDDGAIFYLNGKEIYRLGMPAGTVTSSTYANRTIGDAAYEGPFTIALPGLVSGSNLVAVEVHNADASSSDVVFGMEILEILPAIVPVEFLHPLSDRVTNEGESLSLSVSVTGVSPVYQWYKDNVPIQGATSPIYTIPIARPNDSGVYKVVVTNLISVIESSASITVNPDTTPPSVISAIASANLTTITITYSELVDPFSSQDPGNYSITPTEGGAAVDILSVMLMNETNVVITTTPMQQGIIYSVTINNVSDLSAAGNILQNYTHNIIATDFVFPVFTDWKYNNSGIDLGSDWYKVNYSDSTWQTGTALFGLESNTFVDNNPINTPFTLNNGSGTYITTFYFRKWFTFPYRTNGVKLAFMHAIDDGAIFYINGVEVYRYNMPQGNVVYSTLAASTIEVSDYTMSSFITVTNLVSGPNLIAVEVHQCNLASTDILFGSAMIAQIPSYEIVYVESPQLEYTVQGQYIIFSWNAPGFFLQQNPDLNSSNWQIVPNGDQSPLSLPIEQGNMFFRLAK